MGVRGRPTKWDAWYSKPRWARIRRHQLLEQPLCAFCLERGIVEPATKSAITLSRIRAMLTNSGSGPLMSLCKRCHDSTKRLVEIRGFRPDVGLDGWPLDPRHPVYKRQPWHRGA